MIVIELGGSHFTERELRCFAVFVRVIAGLPRDEREAFERLEPEAIERVREVCVAQAEMEGL